MNLISMSMIRRIALVCAFAVVLGCQAGPSRAIEFKVHKNNSPTLTAVFAVGRIEIGDTERFEAFLSGIKRGSNVAIYLSSNGGNLYEGMRLGLYFRDRRIKTVVEGGADCASACAVAFLGGTDGRGLPWRSSSDDSRLGFHAFRSSEHLQLSADAVQRVAADLLTYGRTIDAPIELLIAGFSTPSDRMFWADNGDLCALGVKVWSNTTRRFLCN